MRKSIIILTFLFLALSVVGCAQENVKDAKNVQVNDTKTLEVKEQAGIEWLEDYDLALQTAQTENKTILINFTGSDWCKWCIKLVDEVFSHQEFAKYAKENLVMLKIDFPTTFKKLPEAEQTKRMELQQKYDVKGYPTILLTNSTGVVIGQTGYQPGGPAKYIEHLEKMIKK